MFPITKNNTIASILIILLSLLLHIQKIHSFLFDTYLGKIIILLFILTITYFNKFIGLFSVFLIVYMFHKSLYTIYYENFTKLEEAPKAPEEKKIETPTIPVEGFDLIGLEDSTRRGKQSNSISCNNALTTSSVNAEAFTGFDGLYTAF
jgi:hypothetical protein